MTNTLNQDALLFFPFRDVLGDDFRLQILYNFKPNFALSAVAIPISANIYVGENTMSGVRVLVGTAKGAFILSSDGKREKWDVQGPLFAGWTIYHMKGSALDPNRSACTRAGDDLCGAHQKRLRAFRS